MSNTYPKYFIIGAARSGTTFLGEVLSQHPDIAYRLEPKFIWRYKNPFPKHDFRHEDEATEDVIKYIRQWFDIFHSKSKKPILLEKTPSNVFRIPFMHKVFPEGKFIHIIRDGRDVALSAEKKWTSIPTSKSVWRRLSSNETPLRDFPFYTSIFFRNVIGRFLFPKKGFVWGPHFPGMEKFREEHSVIESCALQWSKSIDHSLSAFEEIRNDKNYFQVEYNDLMNNTAEVVNEILKFMKLSDNNVVSYALENKRPLRKDYSEEEKEKINIVLPIVEHNLKRLNYL